MAIQWTPDLSVNVPEIDRQHQELFRRVDLLVEAMRMGRGRAEVGSLVSFLELYVAEHFALEEQYMETNGYPRLAAHRAEHRTFTREFQRLKDEHDATGATTALVLAVNQSVAGWLRSHISRNDRLLGAFWAARRLG
jgi:hemerythrin-like metal-binding protein